GTNLLAKCMILMGYRDCGAIAGHLMSGATIAGRFRRYLWRNPKDAYLIGIDSPIEMPKSAIDRKLRKLPLRAFLTAHIGYSDALLLKALSMGFAPLLVIRDPRAILASFVPYVVRKTQHPLHRAFVTMTDSERYSAALHGGQFGNVRLMSLRQRCEALQPWLANRAVMTIRFEDIVGSRGGASDARQLEVLQQLCQRLGLPEEKASEVSGKLFGPGRGTFRKGRVDAWRDEVPADIIEQARDELADIIRAWGYV
ncbi:MAG: hypothetical protein D6698_06255, partial [Gammaproteobacteria bacterium]